MWFNINIKECDDSNDDGYDDSNRQLSAVWFVEVLFYINTNMYVHIIVFRVYLRLSKGFAKPRNIQAIAGRSRDNIQCWLYV